LLHIARYPPNPNDPDDKSNKKDIYDRMKKQLEQAAGRIKRIAGSDRQQAAMKLIKHTLEQLEAWWLKVSG